MNRNKSGIRNLWIAQAILAAVSVLLMSCSLNETGNRIEASGTIEATEVNVASKVTAQIRKLNVDEGATVKMDDTLAIVDTVSYRFQFDQAQANLNYARAQLNLLVEGARKEDIQQAAQASKQAEANFKLASDNLTRIKNLYEDSSATRKQMDDAQAGYTIAQAQYNSAIQAYEKVKHIARPDEIRAAEARVAQAKASADLLQRTLSDCFITAPVNGIVTNKVVEVGDLVTPGAIVFTVSELDTVHLMIYVTELELGKVKLGQEAEVGIDSYPNKKIPGKVIYISENAEFTPKNVQTKEDRVKLVFGVKIQLPNPKFILKPGMPADATIIIENDSRNQS